MCCRIGRGNASLCFLQAALLGLRKIGRPAVTVDGVGGVIPASVVPFCCSCLLTSWLHAAAQGAAGDAVCAAVRARRAAADQQPHTTVPGLRHEPQPAGRRAHHPPPGWRRQVSYNVTHAYSMTQQRMSVLDEFIALHCGMRHPAPGRRRQLRPSEHLSWQIQNDSCQVGGLAGQQQSPAGRLHFVAQFVCRHPRSLQESRFGASMFVALPRSANSRRSWFL